MPRINNIVHALFSFILLFLIAACTANFGEPSSQLDHETLHLAWKTDTGATIQRAPVTVKDIVVLMHGENEIQAFESESGEGRWQFETPAKLWSNSLSNTLDDVLVAGENGRLIAMTTRSGLGEWENSLDGEVLHPPLVDRYVVFAATSAVESAEDQKAELLAINASTGKILWRYPTTNSKLVTPARGSDYVYMGGNDDDTMRLYALGAADGELRWKYEVAAGTIEAIYASDQQGSLTAIDGISGSLSWQHEFVASVSWLIGTEDLLIFEDSASLQAWDIGTGDAVWDYPISAPVMGQPTILDDKLFLLSQTGEVIALDPQTGLEAWRYPTDSKSPAGMVIAQGWIFIADENGSLYAYSSQ